MHSADGPKNPSGRGTSRGLAIGREGHPATATHTYWTGFLRRLTSLLFSPRGFLRTISYATLEGMQTDAAGSDRLGSIQSPRSQPGFYMSRRFWTHHHLLLKFIYRNISRLGKPVCYLLSLSSAAFGPTSHPSWSPTSEHHAKSSHPIHKAFSPLWTIPIK
jgi:hypothetical protein